MLKDTVRKKMFEAMKEKDSVAKSIYTLLLGEIKNKEIALRRELSNDEEIEVVGKLVKQAKEAMEIAQKGENSSFVAERDKEIALLKEFLPTQLTEEEIRCLVENAMKELGIAKLTNQTKGLLMKSLMPQTKGKADGKTVASIVASYIN